MPKRKQYGVYGMGDKKSKLWYIYDRVNKHLVPNVEFKTKQEAKATANMRNTKERG